MRLLLAIAGCALALCGGTAAQTAAPLPSDSTPNIDVWYGLHQRFGRPGSPQKWINILGTVSDADGVTSLAYALNESTPLPVSVGPDQRRLLGAGDFNVEVDRSLLKNGLNTMVLSAADTLGNQTSRAVAIEYEDETWPLPFAIDWGEVENIQTVVQVVDGRWTWDERGIRTAHVGYDRVLTIGDTGWMDYEVTLPITVHGIDASAFTSAISVAPGFGINLHWLGHTSAPVRCTQPNCGWQPTGGSSWYDFQWNQVRLFAEPPPGHAESDTVRIEPGHTYWFRTRAETMPLGNRYRLKVWEEGSREPHEWTVERLTTAENLATGGFLLVAHHVDATFGNVVVTRVGDRSPVSAVAAAVSRAVRKLRALGH